MALELNVFILLNEEAIGIEITVLHLSATVFHLSPNRSKGEKCLIWSLHQCFWTNVNLVLAPSLWVTSFDPRPLVSSTRILPLHRTVLQLKVWTLHWVHTQPLEQIQLSAFPTHQQRGSSLAPVSPSTPSVLYPVWAGGHQPDPAHWGCRKKLCPGCVC